jgi:hypothetical protein
MKPKGLGFLQRRLFDRGILLVERGEKHLIGFKKEGDYGLPTVTVTHARTSEGVLKKELAAHIKQYGLIANPANFEEVPGQRKDWELSNGNIAVRTTAYRLPEGKYRTKFLYNPKLGIVDRKSVYRKLNLTE